MKSHRYGVWGLALGAVLLSAACDDKTEIVIPEPLPDPITVVVVPANLSLDVGQTAQFVATVSGGAAGTVRTVTWASSNQSVATIDANGLVTAVAPGVTTVTATSTADNTARGAAAVTVNDDGSNAPVTLSIKSITTGATNVPVDITNVRGQADVTLNLEGSPPAVISRVETLIDGVVVCSQAFSTGSADVAASDEAQAQVEIVCSVPTQAFNATTGETTWKNGPHNLQARAVRPNGEVVATPSTTLIFNNTNFVNATFTGTTAATSIPAPRSLATAGSLWHTGTITVNLLNVNYGGANDGVAQATVSMTSSGYGTTGLAGCTSGTDALTNPTIAVDDGGVGPALDPDGAGPLLPSTATPGCGPATVTKVAPFTDNMGSVTFAPTATITAANAGLSGVEDIFEVFVTSVTTGGQAGPVCINPDPVNNPQNLNCQRYFANPLRVDNLAPRITQLSIERAPNQYFGPVSFTLSHAAGATTPACTAPCARSVDYGVGGQASTGTSDFLAGPASAPAPVGSGADAGLDETATSNDYVFGIALADLGGNLRTVFATMTPTTIVTTATNAAARRFGWDETAPTLAVGAGPADMETNPDEAVPFLINFLDSATPPAGPSGFLPNPVRVKLERTLPAGVTCHNPDTFAAISCTTGGGFVNDDGMFPVPGSLPAPTDAGYWRYTINVSDAAANPAEQLTLWILQDDQAPTFSGGVVAPSTINGGQAASFMADITENVDLGSAIPYINFAGTAVIGFAQSQLGTFGPENLVAASAVPVTIPAFIRSIENNAGGLPAGGPIMATNFEYDVRDMAGHQLRYVMSPPQTPAGNEGYCPVAGAVNTSTQNCSNRSGDISINVLAGNGGVAVTPAFTALTTANGLNALHGLFTTQPPVAADICNTAPPTVAAGCASATQPTSTLLRATLTGPAGSFASPFASVNFYYLDNITGKAELIGPASVVVTDNTITSTRTYTYTGSWDATSLKVRPAAIGGVPTQFFAIGVTATGDALISSLGPVVNIHGN